MYAMSSNLVGPRVPIERILRFEISYNSLYVQISNLVCYDVVYRTHNDTIASAACQYIL